MVGAFFAWVLALAAGCTVETTEAARPELIGGELADDPAIVVLRASERIGERWYCSGVIVGRRAVLTARHCVEVAPEGLEVYVAPSLPARGQGEPYRAIEVHTTDVLHNPWDSSFAFYDIATIYVDRDFDVAPKPVSFDPPRVDDAVSVHGYGIHEFETRERGREYAGEGRIVRVDRGLVELVGVDAGVCFGDSGSPVLDREGRVLGVSSLLMDFDGRCRIGSRAAYTRVAAHEAMVRRAIGWRPSCAPREVCGDHYDDDCNGLPDDGCAADRAACERDVDCESGRCFAGACAAFCRDDADCPEGEACFGICRAKVASCGDGTVDEGERCDDGALNGTVLSECGYDCQLDGPRCGDGIIAYGIERCDHAGSNGQRHFCPLGCRAASTCGDGVLDDRGCPAGVDATAAICREECDDDACVLECVERECSNEYCDAGARNGSYGSCGLLCSTMARRCGDGIVNANETCDDGLDNGVIGHCDYGCGGPTPEIVGGATVAPRLDVVREPGLD